MVACLLALVVGANAAPWRTYQVYQPEIERHYVVNALEHELTYNHDSSVAWFRDRWFCLWNANQVPAEGKPGQLNYVSTSPDGRTWSQPQPAFSSEECAENPVPCPQGTQWQPNLIIVNGDLWAVWSQNSRDEHGGCYLSTLGDPDGKWLNRLLLWDGNPQPEVDGKRFRLFPSQNPYQLRSGRVLAPVTMIGPQAEDAPEAIQSWWATEKRNSVIYTDDGGQTWHVSPGAVQPWATWAQWEPTVWELADGTVMMFARNNDFRARQQDGPRPTEALLWSKSGDGGATWTPHEYVPLESVVSRMHVLPAGGDRFMMVYNDWPAGRFVHDRKNLALFFTRGAGIDFTAGPGITGDEPFVAYPQMWIKDDTLLVSYSQGNMPRGIKVSRVAPLPDPDRYYVFPRSNVPASPVPKREGNALAFNGGQYIEKRDALALGDDGFSAGAWIRADGDGTLLDNRTTNPQAGFLWGLAYREGKLHPYFYVGSPEHNLVSTLEVRRASWNYVGLTVDDQTGLATFHVNDQTEQTRYTKPANPLAGTTPYIGYKRFEGSRVPGLMGLVRFMAVLPSATLSEAAHAWLHNSLAQELGVERFPGMQAVLAEPLLWLDPADQSSVDGHFAMPDRPAEGVELTEVDGEQALRFSGEASAGLDLDENTREAGDRVSLRLRFRIESGDEHVLCTLGDANHPARLVARAGEVWLEAGDQRVPIGQVGMREWRNILVVTFGDRTFAALDTGEYDQVRHNPVATWAYLGQGYRTGRIPPENSFLVDVASLQSCVERAE